MLALLAALLPMTMQAYDFVEDGIYYLINEDQTTVSVTGDFDFDEYFEAQIITATDRDTYSGVVFIPSSVTHDGKEYPVTAIGDYAFYGCRGMTSIELPSTVTAIGNFAFPYCYGLTSIALSESIKSIGNYGFYGCIGLTEVTIPGSVTYLGPGAFMHCYSMTSVKIEAPLEASTWLYFFFVFNNANALRKVTCYASIPPRMGLGRNTETNEKISNFDDEVYQQAVLYVPSESLDKYRRADQWGDFAHIEPIDGYHCDVNNDGVVNIADVNVLIAAILDNQFSTVNDVNNDGVVTIADVNTLISAILDQ